MKALGILESLVISAPLVFGVPKEDSSYSAEASFSRPVSSYSTKGPLEVGSNSEDIAFERKVWIGYSLFSLGSLLFYFTYSAFQRAMEEKSQSKVY